MNLERIHATATDRADYAEEQAQRLVASLQHDLAAIAERLASGHHTDGLSLNHVFDLALALEQRRTAAQLAHSTRPEAQNSPPA